MRYQLLASALCVAMMSPLPGQDAKKLADAIRANDKASPAALNVQCKLFNGPELAPFLGEAVGKPENSTGGCTWPTAQDHNDASIGVMVTVVGANYFAPPKLAAGYRPVADVGTKGYVIKSLGDWEAGAVQGDKAVVVTLSGPKATDANAIALLKETLKRVH
jgi:hypothetical protein